MTEQTFLQTPVREFVDLNLIFPEETILCRQYRIDTMIMERRFFTYEFINMRQRLNAYFYDIEQYKTFYNDRRTKRLVINETGIDFLDACMMSDTPLERASNEHFIKNANGDVLIFGLGLGMIVFPLLMAEDVKSITIIELHQDLIDLVGPFIDRHDLRKIVTIECGDMFDYKPETNYDTIYLDIWPNFGYIDIYNQQKFYMKRFRAYLNKENPKAFIDAWMYNHHKKLKAKKII